MGEFTPLSRKLNVLIIGFVLTVAATIGLAGSASASITRLCVGYAPCQSAGWSNFGYSTAGGTSYWGMYPGHNCTNYAAYRLIKNGVNASYLQGNGNAYEWAPQAEAHGVTVNSTPAVGSIAWWGANSPGTGSNGHVAYVEAVGPGYLVVSEDSYGGNFDWAKLVPGGYYPTSFLHFKDTPPVSTGTPAPASGGVGTAAYLGADHLVAGQTLAAKHYVVSKNVRNALVMQSDGNLVLYGGPGYHALWNSRTNGHAGAFASLRPDGSFAVYPAGGGTALWRSGVTSGASSSLVMQGDGNLVQYSPTMQPRWYTHTSSADHTAYTGSDKLAVGKRLTVNQYLRSKDGRYALVLQSDGNLVIYGPGYHATWSAQTSGHPGAYGYLQPDGNLVVYPAGGGKALWNTGMARGVVNLTMQGDGNLVKYSSSNAPLWQTYTRGRI